MCHILYPQDPTSPRNSRPPGKSTNPIPRHGSDSLLLVANDLIARCIWRIICYPLTFVLASAFAACVILTVSVKLDSFWSEVLIYASYAWACVGAMKNIRVSVWLSRRFCGVWNEAMCGLCPDC